MKDIEELEEEIIDDNIDEYEEEEEILGVDEEIQQNHQDINDILFSDNVETEDEENAKKKSRKRKSSMSLLDSLRFDLSKPEYNRPHYNFKYNDDKYSGVPLYEMNENRFVFLIDREANLKKAFNLTDIELV